MTRIITDTASDLTYAEAADMGIELVDIPVFFGNDAYGADINADSAAFYQRLAQSKTLPTTSLPSPVLYRDLFMEAKALGDDVLVITLSSGLSGTYNTVKIAAEECGHHRVAVIDSEQATLTQRMLAVYAVQLRTAGLDAFAIAEKLNEIRGRMTMCGMLDTLTYLKKGGRIPPALALIGNAVHIKAVVEIKDGVIQPLAKARGAANGKKRLFEHMDKNTPNPSWPVYFGYTCDIDTGTAFMRECAERFNLRDTYLYEMGGVIGAHLGPGCIAVGYVIKPL